jgi:hypothetical protein
MHSLRVLGKYTNLKVTEGSRKLYMVKFHNLFSMAGTIAAMKLTMGKKERVARMRE